MLLMLLRSGFFGVSDVSDVFEVPVACEPYAPGFQGLGTLPSSLRFCFLVIWKRLKCLGVRAGVGKMQSTKSQGQSARTQRTRARAPRPRRPGPEGSATSKASKTRKHQNQEP